MIINDPNSDVNIQFKMTGDIFKPGIPLHILLAGLNEFHRIIDRSFIGLQGDKLRITGEDRQKYYLVTKGINHNCIETVLGLILTGYQVSMPFISQFGPKGIWNITVQSFEFLKLIFSNAKNGKMPKYEFTNEGREMRVQIGDKTENYYGPVYKIGETSLQHYRALTSLIKEDGINDVLMMDKKEEAEKIYLPKEDKDLFDVPSKVEETPISIECEIFNFNKHKLSGKLEIHENQEVPAGEYSFSVIGSQEIVPFIEAMLKQMVNIKCLIETQVNPLLGKTVKKLQVISVS